MNKPAEDNLQAVSDSERIEKLIKADAEIQDLLTNYKGSRTQAKNAIKQLVKQRDGLLAMKKIVPALRERKLYVFFSYKKKDERTARAIVEALRQHAGDKLEITFMAEFTENNTGKDWRAKIRTEVCRANWFLLLLPDPSEDWDWCLYETGLFDRQPTSADRLICIHHPDIDIPSEIEGYQAVAATETEMENFLRMVFVNPDPIPGMNPINKHLEKKIPSIAKKLVEIIRPPQKEIQQSIYVPHIKLRFDNPKKLKTREDLDDAVVESINDEAMVIFDRSEEPETFGQLRKSVIEPDAEGRWREELFHVVRKIAQGRRFKPVQAVFHSEDEKIFRPVIHAVDKPIGGHGPSAFHITFAEEIGVVDTSSMSNALASLATMLRLAFRFRWEILEKFGKGQLEIEDVERLNNVLERIEQDARSRGVAEQETADLSIFSSEEQAKIGEMYRYWHSVRDPNGGMGELDRALRDKDTQEISAILTRMIPINQEFLEMAANRFSGLALGERNS